MNWTLILRAVAPNGKAEIIDGLAAAIEPAARKANVASKLRIAHFLAQAAHETDGFRTLKEYGGPAYFARYDDRKDLGNVKPGDGARYHGRGIFQLTGRANYHRYGQMLGFDLENNPDLAARPDISLAVAFAYWNDRSISLLADLDDVAGVTKKINGGRNGLAERTRLLAVAKKALGSFIALPSEAVPAGGVIYPPATPAPVPAPAPKIDLPAVAAKGEAAAKPGFWSRFVAAFQKRAA